MRHASKDAAGAAGSASVERALVTNAAGNEIEKPAENGVESSELDAAQQLSAWACVTTLSEPAPGWVESCNGQPPLEQQDMRASGEVLQPAHSAHPAAASARATTNAGARLSSRSTILECTRATQVSIQGDPGCQREVSERRRVNPADGEPAVRRQSHGSVDIPRRRHCRNGGRLIAGYVPTSRAVDVDPLIVVREQ